MANPYEYHGTKTSKKTLISLTPQMRDEVDYICGIESRTRSDLIRQAIRDYIDNAKRKYASMPTIQVKTDKFGRITTVADPAFKQADELST